MPAPGCLQQLKCVTHLRMGTGENIPHPEQRLYFYYPLQRLVL